MEQNLFLIRIFDQKQFRTLAFLFKFFSYRQTRSFGNATFKIIVSILLVVVFYPLLYFAWTKADKHKFKY